MIQLKEIHLYKGYDEALPMKGTITFSGELGEIKLNMSPAQVAKVVNLFADQIVSAVKESAAAFSLESVGVPALEHKSNLDPLAMRDPYDEAN